MCTRRRGSGSTRVEERLEVDAPAPALPEAKAARTVRTSRGPDRSAAPPALHADPKLFKSRLSRAILLGTLAALLPPTTFTSAQRLPPINKPNPSHDQTESPNAGDNRVTHTLST
ncbi:hypothetical protein BST61_g3781 [Cercospora zeina]